jgi:hypothetical protein
MYTIEQVASNIESLKPDLTEFNELLLTYNTDETVKDIKNTSNIYVKLLKTELTLMLYTTHRNRCAYGQDLQTVADLLINNLSNHGVVRNSSYYNHYTNKYYILDNFDDTCHIMAHIIDKRKYLPKYLWDKVRTKSGRAKNDIKVLKPDLMSLKVFENYITNLKRDMPSTLASTYLEQINDQKFTDLREEYMKVIFSKCKKPSLSLQKDLSTHRGNKLPTLTSICDTKVRYYMCLDRYKVRNIAFTLGIPISEDLHNDRDSEYKPFITNLGRAVDTDTHQVAYLFDCLMVLQTAVNKEHNEVYKYFIKHITEHLQLPEYEAVLTKIKQNYKLMTESFNKLTI